MFALNIALGNTAWRLLYKDEETARGVFKALQHPNHETGSYIQDDFGQEVVLLAVTGFMLEDMNKTKMAHVEIALHNARTQALATKTAQADPGLRASSMMNGPSMIDPMGAIMRQNN